MNMREKKLTKTMTEHFERRNESEDDLSEQLNDKLSELWIGMGKKRRQMIRNLTPGHSRRSQRTLSEINNSHFINNTYNSNLINSTNSNSYFMSNVNNKNNSNSKMESGNSKGKKQSEQRGMMGKIKIKQQLRQQKQYQRHHQKIMSDSNDNDNIKERLISNYIKRKEENNSIESCIYDSNDDCYEIRDGQDQNNQLPNQTKYMNEKYNYQQANKLLQRSNKYSLQNHQKQDVVDGKTANFYSNNINKNNNKNNDNQKTNQLSKQSKIIDRKNNHHIKNKNITQNDIKNHIKKPQTSTKPKNKQNLTKKYHQNQLYSQNAHYQHNKQNYQQNINRSESFIKQHQKSRPKQDKNLKLKQSEGQLRRKQNKSYHNRNINSDDITKIIEHQKQSSNGQQQTQKSITKSRLIELLKSTSEFREFAYYIDCHELSYLYKLNEQHKKNCAHSNLSDRQLKLWAPREVLDRLSKLNQRNHYGLSQSQLQQILSQVKTYYQQNSHIKMNTLKQSYLRKIQKLKRENQHNVPYDLIRISNAKQRLQSVHKNNNLSSC